MQIQCTPTQQDPLPCYKHQLQPASISALNTQCYNPAVHLGGKVLELLQAFQQREGRRTDSNLVFPGTQALKRGPASLRTVWLFALKKSGVTDFKFHDLRHNAASYLAMNGASLIDIDAVLGHKTLAMVKRYWHLSETHVKGVAE